VYLLQWSRRGVCELLDDGPRCVGERRLNLDSTTSSSSSSSDHHVEQWKSELSLALPPLYSKHLLTSFISSVSQLFVERVSNATFVRLFNPSFPSLPFARAELRAHSLSSLSSPATNLSTNRSICHHALPRSLRNPWNGSFSLDVLSSTRAVTLSSVQVKSPASS